jgi:hypothetical protein
LLAVIQRGRQAARLSQEQTELPVAVGGLGGSCIDAVAVFYDEGVSGDPVGEPLSCRLRDPASPDPAQPADTAVGDRGGPRRLVNALLERKTQRLEYLRSCTECAERLVHRGPTTIVQTEQELLHGRWRVG